MNISLCVQVTEFLNMKDINNGKLAFLYFLNLADILRQNKNIAILVNPYSKQSISTSTFNKLKMPGYPLRPSTTLDREFHWLSIAFN